jgi:hypothetical protein
LKSSTACWRLFKVTGRISRFAIASGWKTVAGSEGRRTLGIQEKHIDDRQNAREVGEKPHSETRLWQIEIEVRRETTALGAWGVYG